jgi:hypothetical protein
MESIPFPIEAMELARLERTLSGELTFAQIDTIINQILSEMTEKTKSVAYRLLDKLEEKQEKLFLKEVRLLNCESDLLLKIERLKNLLFFLSPEEKNFHLEEIKKMCISLYAKVEPWIIETAQKEIDLLEFRAAFPIVEDLFGKDPISFSSQMQTIADKIDATGSFDSVHELNEIQLAEINRGQA